MRQTRNRAADVLAPVLNRIPATQAGACCSGGHGGSTSELLCWLLVAYAIRARPCRVRAQCKVSCMIVRNVRLQSCNSGRCGATARSSSRERRWRSTSAAGCACMALSTVCHPPLMCSVGSVTYHPPLLHCCKSFRTLASTVTCVYHQQPVRDPMSRWQMTGRAEELMGSPRWASTAICYFGCRQRGWWCRCGASSTPPSSTLTCAWLSPRSSSRAGRGFCGGPSAGQSWRDGTRHLRHPCCLRWDQLPRAVR